MMVVDADEREYFQLVEVADMHDRQKNVQIRRHGRVRWLEVCLIGLILMGMITATVAQRGREAAMWNDQTYTTESFFIP
uniref:DDE_Tnp_1_7 domain-containing protein n=1 Tax=Panagrellus redivivus TaxID=6233 RepID=A0A7E4UTR2_PANRE